MIKTRRLLHASIFCVLLAVEIYIALFVHDSFVRPYIGDLLVTLLLCCFCRIILPAGIRTLPLWVFLFAACIEFGQYFDMVALLGFENNRFLSTVLGRTFSWYDLLCYAFGRAAGFALYHIISTRA